MNDISHVRMKHMGSTAADLEIGYRVDKDKRIVLLQADAFDSALAADFFVRVLGDNGIGAIRDDSAGWNPPRPPYRVFLDLRGQHYEVTAHRLMNLTKDAKDEITVVLEPFNDHVFYF